MHHQDCQNALILRETDPNRFIEVSWGAAPESLYNVDVAVQAYDRAGLIRDISIVLANERANVLALNTKSNIEDNTADLRISMEVTGLHSLARVLAKIKQIPNIIDAKRVKGS